MNTFLPYKSFKKSAQTLDYRRLGKQRIEAWQILEILLGKESRWKNHPAVKMWVGYEVALCQYGIEMCREWIKRGYKDTMLNRFEGVYASMNHFKVQYPPLIFKDGFTDSHKSNLLRKDKKYYSKFFILPDNLPYMWR